MKSIRLHTLLTQFIILLAVLSLVIGLRTEYVNASFVRIAAKHECNPIDYVTQQSPEELYSLKVGDSVSQLIQERILSSHLEPVQEDTETLRNRLISVIIVTHPSHRYFISYMLSFANIVRSFGENVSLSVVLQGEDTQHLSMLAATYEKSLGVKTFVIEESLLAASAKTPYWIVYIVDAQGRVSTASQTITPCMLSPILLPYLHSTLEQGGK